MAKVTWWLSTRHGYHGRTKLWVREVEMGFLPDEGDTVHILGSEEEPAGSVSGTVYRRHWDLTGAAHLQFQDHLIDPPDDFRPSRMMTSWWTDRDGDFEAMLPGSGWMDYHEWTSTRS
jgi:hypothetical protein